MRKFKYIALFTAAMSVSLILSSCGLFQSAVQVDAKQLIKDAMAKSEDIKAVSFEIHPVLTIDDAGKKGTIDVTLKGDSDMLDEKNSKAQMMISADVDMVPGDQPEMKFKMDLEVRVLGEWLYANLSKLDIQGDLKDQVEPFVKEYMNTWYKFALEGGMSGLSLKDIQKSFMEGFTSGGDMTEEQKQQMKELIKATEFFTAKSDAKENTFNGASVYTVDVSLNKPGLVTFAKEAAKISKQEMSASDIQEMEKAMQNVDYNGTLFIGKDDKFLYGMNGTLNVKDTENNLTVGAVLDLKFKDFNKAKTVEAPADAKEFNPLGALTPPEDLEGEGTPSADDTTGVETGGTPSGY